MKYLKKSDTTEKKIEEEFINGAHQIELYLKDMRLAKRENLRKYVVVFSGFDVVKLQEV